MKKNILILDDEPLILKYLSALLQPHYNVFSFESPLEAIKLVDKNESIDFILSDYLMKDINGIDFLDFIINKKYFNKPSERFIFMTAYEGNDIYHNLIKTGCRIVKKTNLDIEFIRDIFEEKI